MIKNLSYVFVLAAMFANGVYGLNAENATSPTNHEFMQQFIDRMNGDVRNAMNNLTNEERQSIRNVSNLVTLHDREKRAEQKRLKAKYNIDGITEDAKLKAAYDEMDADLRNFSTGFWINNGMPDYQLVNNSLRHPRPHARMLATFNELGENHILVTALNELFNDLNVKDYICNSTRLDVETNGGIPVEYDKAITDYINRPDAETTARGWYKLPSSYPFMKYYHRNAGLLVSLIWNDGLPSVIRAVYVSPLQNS